MTNAPHKQKLYCYVDETGQDRASSTFIVVAVVSRQEQDRLRDALAMMEDEAGHRTAQMAQVARIAPLA